MHNFKKGARIKNWVHFLRKVANLAAHVEHHEQICATASVSRAPRIAPRMLSACIRAAGGSGARLALRSRCCACGALSAASCCEACKAARYCDAACQRADWPRHKTMCKEMAAALVRAPAAVAAASCTCEECALKTAANAAPVALRMRVARLPEAAAAAACLREPVRVRAASDDALIPALTCVGKFYMRALGATGRELPCATLARATAREREAWRAALALCRDALRAGADAHASLIIVNDGFPPLRLPSMLWMACRMGSLELFRVVAEH
jgi:hypothetical protein